MARYAVMAHIDHAQPHRARRDVSDAPIRHREIDDASEAIDLGRPASEPWRRVRELWAQTTFYLFDANSWR